MQSCNPKNEEAFCGVENDILQKVIKIEASSYAKVAFFTKNALHHETVIFLT